MDVFDYPEMQPKMPLDMTSLDTFRATFDETFIPSHTSHWHLLHPGERAGRLAHVNGYLSQLSLSEPHKDELKLTFRDAAQRASLHYASNGKAQRDKLDAKFRAQRIAEREARNRENAKSRQTGRPVSKIADLRWTDKLDHLGELLDQIIEDEASETLLSESLQELYLGLNSLTHSVRQRHERMTRRSVNDALATARAEARRLRAELDALKAS